MGNAISHPWVAVHNLEYTRYGGGMNILWFSYSVNELENIHFNFSQIPFEQFKLLLLNSNRCVLVAFKEYHIDVHGGITVVCHIKA